VASRRWVCLATVPEQVRLRHQLSNQQAVIGQQDDLGQALFTVPAHQGLFGNPLVQGRETRQTCHFPTLHATTLGIETGGKADLVEGHAAVVPKRAESQLFATVDGQDTAGAGRRSQQKFLVHRLAARGEKSHPAAGIDHEGRLPVFVEPCRHYRRAFVRHRKAGHPLSDRRLKQGNGDPGDEKQNEQHTENDRHSADGNHIACDPIPQLDAFESFFVHLRPEKLNAWTY
jgi:hypothetical protein